MHIDHIILNEELKSYLSPLTPDEYAGLVASVKSDGRFTDPLVVWLGKGILVDGYNRYRVWKEDLGGDPDKSPDVIERPFDSIEHVKCWMMMRQAGRRNWTPGQRAVAVLEIQEEMERRAGKGNQEPKVTGGEWLASAVASGKEKCVSADTNSVTGEAGRVRDRLAEAAGVSTGTIHAVQTVLKEGSEQLKQDLKDGKITANAAAKAVKAEKEEAAKASPEKEKPATEPSNRRSLNLEPLMKPLGEMRRAIDACYQSSGKRHTDEYTAVKNQLSLLFKAVSVWRDAK